MTLPYMHACDVLPSVVRGSTACEPDRSFPPQAGHFDALATELAGDWLGISFVIGAFFCNVGLYNAQVWTHMAGSFPFAVDRDGGGGGTSAIIPALGLSRRGC